MAEMENEGLWLFAILALMGFGNGGLFGGRGSEQYATSADVQRAVDFSALERQNNEGVAATQAAATAVTGAVKDGNFNILGELRDVQAAVAAGFAESQKCCCETLRAIDGINYTQTMNASEIKSAIHAEGEATRSLIAAQETQRLRDELSVARSANADYMQSQYILGQMGKYYTNPPCYGSCGGNV